MRIRSKYFLMVIGFISFTSFAIQEWSEKTATEANQLLLNVQEFFVKTNSYEVTITYQSFTGDLNTKPFESSIGFLKKKGEKIHMYNFGKRVIQDDKLRVTVDSTFQIIQVGNKLKNQTMGLDRLEGALKDQIQKVKYRITERGSDWQIYFKEEAVLELYQISVSKDYSPIEVLMVQRKEHAIEGDAKGRTAKPKVLIRYSNYKKNTNISDQQFTYDKYITIEKGKVASTKAYNSYQLIDTRTKN